MKKKHALLVAASAAIGATLFYAVIAGAAVRHPVSSNNLHPTKLAGPSVPAAPSGSAASAMAVFKRAATGRDSLTSGASAAAAALDNPSVAEDLQPGTTVAGSDRLLIDNAGGTGVSLYGYVTSKGDVCTAFTATYGSAGCTDQFTNSTPVAWDVRDVDAIGSGQPAIVDGIAPDNVKAIAVIVDGTSYPAELANNAFFFQLPAGAEWPSSLTVTYKNGAQESLPIPPLAAAKR